MKLRVSILFVMVFVSTSIFSQRKLIYKDTLLKAPYNFQTKGNKFRLRLLGEHSAAIDKFNVAWMLIDTFEFYHEIYLKDITDDGYLDIGVDQKWTSDVWIFNASKKNYVKSGAYPINDFMDDKKIMVLLYNKLHVYCDYWTYKNGSWQSSLFLLKNCKRVELGIIYNNTKLSEKLDTYVNKSITIKKRFKDGEKTVKEIPWYEPEKYNYVKEIPWHKPEKYNYVNYWKQNWRKFLPK